MSTDSTGLAKTGGRSPAVITTPEEFNEKLRTWTSEHFNVLSPFSTFTGLQEGYGLIASRVSIDPDPQHGEVYGDSAPWVPKGHVALAKVGLRKIAECAGMSTTIRRTDPYTIPHYWELLATARWRGIDGSIIEREAPFEWDMRDGSPRTKGFTPKQIEEARKHGLRHGSTRAINAAIREYGVKQTYSREEMAKPFVVLRVVYMPDRSDPEVRRILAENALAGTTALYAQAHQALPSGGHVIDALADEGDDEPITTRSVGSGSTAAPAAEAPATDTPPSEDAVRVAKVEERSFTYRKGPNAGKTGTRYVIVDSRGVEHSTFDEGHAKDARRFAADRAWVEFNEESDGQYTNLIEIVRAGEQPSLLPSADKL